MARLVLSDDWSSAALPRWPYLAVIAGAIALVLAGQDDPRVCTRTVQQKAQQIDAALPNDPAVMESMFERLTRAADLCERGQPQQAEQILKSLPPDHRT
jgi:hypothetical protein